MFEQFHSSFPWEKNLRTSLERLGCSKPMSQSYTEGLARGAPISIPDSYDWPMIGFWSTEQATESLDALSQLGLAARKLDFDTEIQNEHEWGELALSEMMWWFTQARETKKSILTFYG